MLQTMNCVRLLDLRQTDFVRQCQNYRKTLVHAVESLSFLDDKPVDDAEKRTAKAFITGGLEGEKSEKQKIQQEKEQSNQRQLGEVRTQRQDALLRWQQKQLDKEKNMQLGIIEELSEYEKELERLRLENIQLREEEDHNLKNQELEKMARQSGISKETDQSLTEIIPEPETIDQLKIRYQDMLLDPEATPEHKTDLKKLIDTRFKEEVLGFEKETPLQENEFEQEVVESRIEAKEASLKGSQLQVELLNETINKIMRGEEIPVTVQEVVDKDGFITVNGQKTGEVYQDRQDLLEGKKKIEILLNNSISKEGSKDELYSTQDIRWTIDLENSLETLLVASKFNFQKATEQFNLFLADKQKREGKRFKPQEWPDLARKWADIQRRNGKGPDLGTELGESTDRSSDVPEELKSISNWDELD